eukprot:8917936-Karenia_brevis.AAC.1
MDRCTIFQTKSPSRNLAKIQLVSEDQNDKPYEIPGLSLWLENWLGISASDIQDKGNVEPGGSANVDLGSGRRFKGPW